MNHTCRGTINLAGAFIDTVDSCSFAINGGSQIWHLRAGSEIERQRWVTALELAKAKAIKNLASGIFSLVVVDVSKCLFNEFFFIVNNLSHLLLY